MNKWNHRAGWPGTAVALLVLAFTAGCVGTGGTQTPVDYAAIIAAPERTEADRATDVRRKAVQLLAFTGVRPGMKVLDLATGAGYSTELMARAVGPTGVVYGQDAMSTIERARVAFDVRAKSPSMKNVVRVLRNFDDPVPADVRDFDVITFFFEYHEMPKAGVDRLKMNRRFFDILKPGGVLVIADHSARTGDGGNVGPTLHRIEESLVRQDVEAAGFRLIAEGKFLRNPEDKRDVTVFKSPVPVDDFLLKFERPR